MSDIDEAEGHPRSEFEAKVYYVGLPSVPTLVFRTGAPFRRPTGPEAYHVRKKIMPVFNEQIAKVWDEMGPQLCAHLDSAAILWTSIDVVRFAEEEKPPGPIVLWIGVKPGTLSKADAQSAAVGCEEILGKFGIAGVDIAFRESLFVQSAGPKLLNSTGVLLDPIADVRSPLTAALGLPIASRLTPTLEGTGGAYISEDGNAERIYILTARHVVLPPDGERKLSDNETYDTEASDSRIEVILPGEGSLKKLKETIPKRIWQEEEDVSAYNERLECVKKLEEEGRRDRNVSDLEKARKFFEYELDSAKGALSALSAFRDDIEKHWSQEEQRVIGHVAYSPAISFSAQDYTEDWALIELDRSKIDWDNFRGNVVDLGAVKNELKFGALMYPDRTAATSFRYSSPYRLLPVQDILTKDEMRFPTVKDENGDPCLAVIKNGRATGTTAGLATGIDSFVRQYFDDGSHMTSREWAIHGYDRDAFSAPGDSGAIIVDGKRRAGGLIHGGAGQKDEIDITYATPFYWLMERIKTRFPHARLY